MSNLCDPTDYSLPGSSVHRIPRQKYWSGLPFPSPGDLPNPGIEPTSPALASRVFTTDLPAKPRDYDTMMIKEEKEIIVLKEMSV